MKTLKNNNFPLLKLSQTEIKSQVKEVTVLIRQTNALNELQAGGTTDGEMLKKIAKIEDIILAFEEHEIEQIYTDIVEKSFTDPKEIEIVR